MANPHTHGGDINVCTNDHVRQAHQMPAVEQAHEMSLDERRALVVKDIFDDENNFVVGTISWQLLRFYQWLQTNTDTFDAVMVRMTLDGGDSLMRDDEEIKELVRLYMQAD